MASDSDKDESDGTLSLTVIVDGVGGCGCPSGGPDGKGGGIDTEAFHAPGMVPTCSKSKPHP